MKDILSCQQGINLIEDRGMFFYLHRCCQPRPTLLHTHGTFSNFEFVKDLTFVGYLIYIQV